MPREHAASVEVRLLSRYVMYMLIMQIDTTMIVTFYSNNNKATVLQLCGWIKRVMKDLLLCSSRRSSIIFGKGPTQHWDAL
jgi:hypothetical protein